MQQTLTATLIREDDQAAHIEDTELWTVIRHNAFVELTWNELTDGEKRQIYVNMFNPCGL